jgi:hypothetical protein
MLSTAVAHTSHGVGSRPTISSLNIREAPQIQVSMRDACAFVVFAARLGQLSGVSVRADEQHLQQSTTTFQ